MKSTRQPVQLPKNWSHLQQASERYLMVETHAEDCGGYDRADSPGVYQSKGLATTQLAPQGAAAGDPSSRPCLPAIDCSFGHRAAAAWGVRLLSSLFQQSQQAGCCASTGTS